MIRLLNAASLEFEMFADSDTANYAILSHRWRDDEVRFEEMTLPNVAQKKGYQKIKACCQQALSAGIRYVWVDTCCIDKRSSAELSEAINSMFRWYEDSTECYAYLDDVTSEEDLHRSEWFSRCWTLQELIAPKKRSLRFEIAEITRIPQRVLKGGRFSSYSIAQRMSWASRRRCMQIEDEAYSLLGLFDVNLPLIYGERRKAFFRLQEEIIKHSDDHTIFAWSTEQEGYRGLLATSPACFSDCYDVVEAKPPILTDWQLSADNRPYEMTSSGLCLHLNLFSSPVAMDTYVAQLDCTRQSKPDDRLGIYLCQVPQRSGNSFARVMFNGRDLVSLYVESRILIGSPRRLYVIQNERTLRSLRVNKLGFGVASHCPFTCHSQCPVDEKVSFLEMPEGATGHTVTLQFPASGSKLGAAVLGFDSNLYPVCTLFDSDAAARLPEALKACDHKWIDARIEHSQGTAAVMLWRVAQTPGVWYFYVPAERLSSSEVWLRAMEDNEFFSEATEKVPSSLEPFLSVYVEELDVVVRVAKEPYGDRTTWVFRLMKLADCLDRVGTIFDVSKESPRCLDGSSGPISSESYQDRDEWIQLGVKPNKNSVWGELAEVFCGGSNFDPSLHEPITLGKFKAPKRLGLAYELLRVPEGERRLRDRWDILNQI